MPRDQKPIPFVPDQKSGYEQLAGGSPLVLNVVFAGGALRRRPGIGMYSGAFTQQLAAGQDISALRVTYDGRIYAVAGSPHRYLYRVSATGVTGLSTGAQSDLRGTLRPVIAEVSAGLVITGGDRVQKVDTTTDTASPLANAPQGAFVIANSSRLLINDPTYAGHVDFSDPNLGAIDFVAYESWLFGLADAGWFSAESRPDPVVALAENSNEVFVFGSTSLQVFASDSDTVFAPVVSREFGCQAPYSVVKVDSQFAWLDHMRRFVMSDGRTVTPFSDGIQQTLNDFSDVSDAYGYRFMEGTVDALVWTFPTVSRTFAYQKGIGWAEWTVGSRLPFAVTAHCLSPLDGVNVIAASGVVGSLSMRNQADGVTPIEASVTTGYQDRGTTNRKRCICVRFALKRGKGGTTEPVGFVSWRDGQGSFQPPIPLSFGTSSDLTTVVQFYGLGIYRSRQWKFEFTGSEELSLVDASEEFEVLGN